MSRIVSSLFLLLILSCSQNDRANRLMFKDVSLVDSLMNRQNALMKRIHKPDTVRAVSWEIIDGNFVLNKVDSVTLVMNEDSILKEWGIRKKDYNFLKVSSYALSEEGICGALEVGYPNIFGFLYRCDLKGFDTKERLILLKSKSSGDGEEPVPSLLKVVLDENESMVLGY